jgi:hypothetical protein
MFCPNCNRFTLIDEHIGETGKINKLCYKCLKKKKKVENVIQINDMEDVSSLTGIFPQSFILFPIELIESQTLEEFGSDFSDLLLENYGYKFRYFIKFIRNRFDKIIENHLYAYCNLSNQFQAGEVKNRKRLNYGFQRYNCNGTLLIHENQSYISIFIKHDVEHKFAKSPLDEELVKKIQSMSLRAFPSHILKELKAREPLDQIINLSLNQVNNYC